MRGVDSGMSCHSIGCYDGRCGGDVFELVFVICGIKVIDKVDGFCGIDGYEIKFLLAMVIVGLNKEEDGFSCHVFNGSEVEFILFPHIGVECVESGGLGRWVCQFNDVLILIL